MIFYRKLYLIFKFVIVGLVLVNIAADLASAESKSEELQRKIADIRLLKEQLVDRKRQAETMLTMLATQQNDLVSEIRLLQKSLGFNSYIQAKNHDRAFYNIELLRTIIAYSTEFTKKIKIYQAGHDKLTYLHQLAEDDIKMIRTLNDFEIDALTTQISLMINRYLFEAHIIQIEPKNINLVTPEKIWKGIIKGTY